MCMGERERVCVCVCVCVYVVYEDTICIMTWV